MLAVEISELKSEIRLKEVEIENLKAQIALVEQLERLESLPPYEDHQ